MNQGGEIDLVRVFVPIWNKRKIIIIASIATALLFGVISFFLEPQYLATVSLYKQDSDQKQGGLLSIASQFGFSAGGDGSTFDIKDLLESNRFRNEILLKKWKTDKYEDSITLLNFLNVDIPNQDLRLEIARGIIGKKINIFSDKVTGLNKISVEISDPKLACDIANYTTKFITSYALNERKSKTKQNINYINNRLRDVKSELRDAEDALTLFRKRNRVITESPQLQIEYARLQRAVTIKQEVFLTLQKQLEMAEIDLVKETPVINVLDVANIPQNKSKPNKKIMVVLGGLLGFFGSIGVFIVMIFISKIKSIIVNYNKKNIEKQ